MLLARQIAAEMMKALAVLALVFLSFAHQPAAIAGDGTDVLGNPTAGLSYCGGEPDDDGADHVPCHACRFDPAALPQPPCVATLAYALFVAFAVSRGEGVIVYPDVYRPDSPRAPPAPV